MRLPSHQCSKDNVSGEVLDLSVSGHHWLLDLSDCKAKASLLERAEELTVLLPQAATDAGMKVVGQAFHQFDPSGYTGAVILAESHVTVHTWPESRFVAIDVYVCDFNASNRAKGERLTQALLEIFKPGSRLCKTVQRQSSGGACIG